MHGQKDSEKSCQKALERSVFAPQLSKEHSRQFSLPYNTENNKQGIKVKKRLSSLVLSSECFSQFNSDINNIKNASKQDNNPLSQGKDEIMPSENSEKSKCEEDAAKPSINHSNGFFKDTSNILKRLQLKAKMKQITKYLPSRMNKNISRDHLKWIGDKSAVFPDNESDQQDTQDTIVSKNTFEKSILNLFRRIPVMHPTNKFRQYWYIGQLMLIIMMMILIPIELVFAVTIESLISVTGEKLICFIIILDTLIQMNTGYYQKGMAIENRAQIIKRYFVDHIFDGILADAAFFFHSMVLREQTSFLLVLYYFKMNALKGIEKRIFEFIQISPMNMNFVLLMRLTLNVLLVSHYFACIWVQVGYWERGWLEKYNTLTITWMEDFKIQQSSWLTQYISAYYFSTVTMITVGYGDIKATSEVEMVLCTVHMIIACGVFAFTINQIGFIFEQFGKQEKQFQQNMYTINRYMEEYKISRSLQYQIKQYLEYYWTQTQDNFDKQEKEIIGQLTEDLRFQMKQEANRLVIKDTHIFSSNFSQSLIEQLVPHIKETTHIPDKYIVSQNADDDDGSIYFIKKGSLKVVYSLLPLDPSDSSSASSAPVAPSLGLSPALDREVQIISQGNYFGQIRFFTGLPRNASVITTDFTKLLSIRREDFLSVIKRFPLDYEVLAQINHVFAMEGKLTNCGVKCFSCKSFSHTLKRCPYLQLNFNRSMLTKKSNAHQLSQMRDQTFVRDRSAKLNAYCLLPGNKISQFDFLDSLSCFDNDSSDEEDTLTDPLEYEKGKQKSLQDIQQRKSILQTPRSRLSYGLTNQDSIVNKNNQESTNIISSQSINNNPSNQFGWFQGSSQLVRPLIPLLEFSDSHQRSSIEETKISAPTQQVSFYGFYIDSSQVCIFLGRIVQQTQQEEEKDSILLVVNSDKVLNKKDEKKNSSEKRLSSEKSLKKVEFFDEKPSFFNMLTNQQQGQVFLMISNMLLQEPKSDEEGLKAIDSQHRKQLFQKQKTSGRKSNLFNNSNSSNFTSSNGNLSPVSPNYCFRGSITSREDKFLGNYASNQFSHPMEQNQHSNPSNPSNYFHQSQNQHKSYSYQNTEEHQPIIQRKSILQPSSMMNNIFAYSPRKNEEDEFKNSFEHSQIFKNFLVHNNIDIILKKANIKSEEMLRQYQQLAHLKNLAKKSKRREIKNNARSHKNSALFTPSMVNTNGSKSIGNSGRSGIFELLPHRSSYKVDCAVSVIEASSRKIIDDYGSLGNSKNMLDQQEQGDMFHRVQCSPFQNKYILSISDLLNTARKERFRSEQTPQAQNSQFIDVEKLLADFQNFPEDSSPKNLSISNHSIFNKV